jgi:hypothetical protein
MKDANPAGIAKGPGMVLQPEEGESYWQPVWANGYSTVTDDQLVRTGCGPACDSVSGNGLPLVSGRKGAATMPRIKNRPTIVAAGPYPPRLTISVPAISGPMHEIQRGALKQKATAVPRIRVGKSSGSQTGAQAQIPPVKKR